MEGVNTGGAATIDSSSCSSITNGRDRWYFEDNGDGYCSLKVGVPNQSSQLEMLRWEIKD